MDCGTSFLNMLDTFLTSPIVSLSSLVAVIILVVYNFLSPKLKARHVEYDDAGTGLIKLLKETKDELAAENAKMRKDFEILRAEFDILSKEHKLFKDIFQGRDADTIKSREKMNKAADIIESMNDILVKTYAKIMSVESLVKK